MYYIENTIEPKKYFGSIAWNIFIIELNRLIISVDMTAFN